MQNGYHIYFDDQSYWIVTTLDRATPQAVDINTLVLENPDVNAIKKSIKTLDKKQVENVVVLTDKLEATWNIFKQQFLLIQAGGGLVKNDKDEYLFIFRRGKWDLPKGKLDDGETIAECALREVNEETGLQSIVLGNHLCNTYHIYHQKKKIILKESVWYNMSCASGQTLTPQTEEDIEEIRWLTKDQWNTVLENIFPSIKNVLSVAV